MGNGGLNPSGKDFDEKKRMQGTRRISRPNFGLVHGSEKNKPPLFDLGWIMDA